MDLHKQYDEGYTQYLNLRKSQCIGNPDSFHVWAAKQYFKNQSIDLDTPAFIASLEHLRAQDPTLCLAVLRGLNDIGNQSHSDRMTNYYRACSERARFKKEKSRGCTPRLGQALHSSGHTNA